MDSRRRRVPELANVLGRAGVTTAGSRTTVGVAREVVRARVSGLRPHPGNPRKIRPERLEALKAALEADAAMLEARPLIALPDGTVIAGNQRLRAAVELGWETIPVVYVDLDEQTARLWMLRDNNEYGEWDTPALEDMLASLGDVDLALTGFDPGEIDRLLAGIEAKRERDPDDASALPEGVPDSKLGEVYELGPHRLMCGDARDLRAVRALVGSCAPEVLWTDPPYGVEYVGKTRAALRIENDDPEGLPSLLDASLRSADAVLAQGARFYIAAPAGLRGTEFRLAIERAGWQFHQALVWVKDAFVLGHSDYHYRHEDVLYGWKPGPGRPGRGRHAGSKWQGDHAQDSVFEISRPKRSDEHPTMKPVELVARQLANSSRAGDAILDPFAGSGTTLIAADQLRRRAFLMEIDPRYCDVIRERWERWHG
ncbi:MAG: DNA methyltransferase [Gaiellaceae bacterium]|jgi:DNA modification methylase